MIGTFYNPGWLVAHAAPLSVCDQVDEVLVVCDAPLPVDLPKVSFHCPSRKLVRRLGRNLARVVTLSRVAWTFRPQIYMGYHVMPNGPLALVAARLFGGKAIYQMTGGPIQITRGGYQSENPLLAATKTPSRVLEFLMFSMVRCFDSVAVRGQRAQAYVAKHKLARSCLLITGAIDTDKFTTSKSVRDLDAIYVGRLIEYKGVDDCIRVASALGHINPQRIVGLVGGGPLESQLRSIADECDANAYLRFFGRQENVIPFLHRSKVFLLLSPSEGMSIAMLEAMATGLPVVVANVGDLSDVFTERSVGILIDDIDSAKVAEQINELIDDDVRWAEYSENSRKTIVEDFSVTVIGQRWARIISELVKQ